MEPKKVSEELIHEFTEKMDNFTPSYSDEDENIIMENEIDQLINLFLFH